MRIGSVLRSAEIALITIISALVLGTCGGSGRRAVVQPQDRVAPPIQAAESLDEVLMELEGMECPDGVDAELWGELKDALEEALNDSCRAGIYPRRSATGMDGGGHKWPPYSEGIRFVSTPPGDRVSDLALTDHFDATYTLEWRYRNLGDYDQNGTVGISDITPLAIHYNEEVPEEDKELRNSIQAVVDGSGNGIVDIADITPIAMNYGTCCAEYSIRSSLSNPESIEDTEEVGAAPITLAEGEDRKTFSVEISEEPRTYIAVAPMDAAKTPGELSNVLTIPNHPPVAQLLANPIEGDAPLDVSFDASGSSDIDGPIVSYEWDWEGDGVYDHDSGNVPTAEHTYDIAQVYDPRVRVMDEHNGTCTASMTVTAGAWRIFTAADHFGSYTCLAVVNGCPAISYIGDYDMSGPYELIYVRATGPLGMNWGDPVLVDDDDYGVPPSGLVSLAVVNGYPAIASCCRGDHKLKYTRANDASGDAWGEPLVLGEAGRGITDDSATGLSLRVVNENPAIAYEGRNLDGVAYMRALDADGDSWGSPLWITAYGFPSMAVVNNKPAICYNVEPGFRYVRALDAYGTVWGGPVAVDQTGTFIPYNSIAIINGHPAISYTGVINEPPYACLRYVRANDPNGETWEAPLILDSSTEDFVGKHCSLAAINGRPAISYVTLYGESCFKLHYVEARDANGDDWREPVTLVDAGSFIRHSSLKEVNDHPAIAYSDGRVKFAIYY